ncbi:MAG: 50S ribosomal protein L9 [Victivallales bacterium]|jgi:large subunit ribosomal protein L9|nr:50S ribosomal protein L9 [Victivallales bacterium]
MAKELILLDDVKDLGKIGDVVKVADGYARNYLIPKKLAQPVSKGALRQVEARKIKLQKEHEERVAIAKAVADKLAALTVVIPMKVGENDQLFGSVSAQMIADVVKAQGIEIEKNEIVLEENLRALGDYTVNVKLNAEVTGTVKVQVTKQEA